MPPEKSNRRLGRGLDALFSSQSPQAEETESALREIPVSEIVSNPFQPRKTFNEDELNELLQSLKESGLHQPITERRTQK
jgi:ParB family chromosome partitioning protein